MAQEPRLNSIEHFGGLDRRRGSWQHWPDRETGRTTVQKSINLVSRDGAAELRPGLDSGALADSRNIDIWCRGLPLLSLPRKSINMGYFSGILDMFLTDNDGVFLTDNKGALLIGEEHGHTHITELSE